MRFYVKLLVAILIFACGMAVRPFEMAADLAFDLRVAYVTTCGSPGDFERLLDDTQRLLAVERGGMDAYAYGKRFEALLADRLADAGQERRAIGEEENLQIRSECAEEAARGSSWLKRGQPCEERASDDERATRALAFDASGATAVAMAVSPPAKPL